MDQLYTLVNSSLSKILMNFVVMLFLIGNIYYMVEINKCEIFNEKIEVENLLTSKELDQAKNKEGYLNSRLNKDKQTKIQNYKNRGEEVIDLSKFEVGVANPKKDYIPEIKQTQNSNIQQWYNFIINSSSSNINSNYCN